MENNAGITWDDIEIPCSALVKQPDIKGVTENPPLETKVLSSTINRDYFYLQFEPDKPKWFPRKSYILIEVIVPVINPQPTTQ
jgi:hypothetical protein